jgi:hypothetical protein
MKRQLKEPERTFVFRISPEGMPRVYRTVELSEKQSLHHLHLAIHQSFSLKGKALYAFYLSGKRWDPESEYGGPLAASPRKTKKALLGRLALNKARPFLYLFNFEKENWFDIEWIEERKAEPVKNYPHFLAGEGELPAPASPLEEVLPSSLKTLVQNLKPALYSWDPATTKPRSPKEVQEAKNLVEALYKVLQEKGENRWPLLDEATGMILADWLLSLPHDFVKRGLTEEALRLCEFFAPYCERDYFKCEKALVLASIDKKRKQKAALEQICEVSARFPLLAEEITKQTGFLIVPTQDRSLHLPEDPRIWTKVAEFLWKIDHVAPAERFFRSALDLASDDIYERELILAKFIAMLEENERQDEAIELIRSELDRG